MKGQLPDLQAVLTRGNSHVSATRTASANGSGVDCSGMDGQIFAMIEVGTVSGTSPTLDVTLQESDDDSSYSSLALVGTAAVQVTATGSIQLLQATRTKRYVRVVFTIGGTSPSFACASQVFGQKKF